MTAQDIIEILEKKALDFEDKAAKEDAKAPTDRNLNRLYGCHLAARAMRDLIHEIRLKEELT